MATSESGQTYSNHARFYPLFHFFAAPILLANLLWALWQIVRAPSLSAVWSAIVAAALVGGLTAARLMALTVQDRVIRLEMRLRLREVLPADLPGSDSRADTATADWIAFRKRCRAAGACAAGAHRFTWDRDGHQESRHSVAGRLPSCVTCVLPTTCHAHG